MTPALRKLLTALSGPLDDGYESEVVRDGRQCWLGIERVPGRVLDEAIRCSALERVSGDDKVERYVINGIGRAVLRRPELAGEILAAVLSGRQFTVRDDRVADLDAPLPQRRR